MRRSNLKVTIEYHTRGLNTKEEHFSTGIRADALFRGIKSHLDGTVSQADIDAILAAISSVALVKPDDDEDTEEEDDGTRPWTAEDEKRIECNICKCTFEDWQTASCHLAKYHLYNCDDLKSVPPETLTISALWFNTMSNNMDTVSDTNSMEDAFRNYVLKRTYDWTIDELTDGVYAKWYSTPKKEK